MMNKDEYDWMTDDDDNDTVNEYWYWISNFKVFIKSDLYYRESVLVKSTTLFRRVWVRVRVIQMVFLLLCMAEPDKTTRKSTRKQPHGRDR